MSASTVKGLKANESGNVPMTTNCHSLLPGLLALSFACVLSLQQVDYFSVRINAGDVRVSLCGPFVAQCFLPRSLLFDRFSQARNAVKPLISP